MPTLYLTEDHALVRRDTEDCLLVQIPEQRGEGGAVLIPTSKRRIPLHKVDDVIVMGDVTLTASALQMLLGKEHRDPFSRRDWAFQRASHPRPLKELAATPGPASGP